MESILYRLSVPVTWHQVQYKQRMCTSVNSSQADATSVYDNLKALPKHFAMNPKSTEFLNNTLNALELNSVHMLNWGSTRMAGFMDACVQAS